MGICNAEITISKQIKCVPIATDFPSFYALHFKFILMIAFAGDKLEQTVDTHFFLLFLLCVMYLFCPWIDDIIHFPFNLLAIHNKCRNLQRTDNIRMYMVEKPGNISNEKNHIYIYSGKIRQII